MNAPLRHLIYDYDQATAVMSDLAPRGDKATFDAALATCAKIRGQIEALMPQDFCDPMANNKVEYIK